MTVTGVWVRLEEGADSGFARILEQFLTQNLTEFEDKRRQALALRGRVLMTASDHDSTVTLGFGGTRISIWDGAREPTDASITGPYPVLVDLIQGEANPLWEHFRGRIKIRSSLGKPLLPLRVHGLMKLEPEGVPGRPGLRLILTLGALGAIAAWAAAFAFVLGG